MHALHDSCHGMHSRNGNCIRPEGNNRGVRRKTRGSPGGSQQRHVFEAPSQDPGRAPVESPHDDKTAQSGPQQRHPHDVGREWWPDDKCGDEECKHHEWLNH